MIDMFDLPYLAQMPKPKALWPFGTLAARFGTDKLRGYQRGTRLTMGNALAAALLKSALDAGVTLRRSAAVEGLMTGGRRISDVRVSVTAGTANHEARVGVVLAWGGVWWVFAEWRGWRRAADRMAPHFPGAGVGELRG